jgi:hypothetical protein
MIHNPRTKNSAKLTETAQICMYFRIRKFIFGPSHVQDGATTAFERSIIPEYEF